MDAPDEIGEAATTGDPFLEPLIDVDPPSRSFTGGSPQPLPEGTRIGEFTVQRFVKEGGSGEVYLAIQESPRRKVALKLLRRQLLGTPARVRFEREAQIQADLDHPAIAKVYAASSGNALAQSGATSAPWIAMEWLDGTLPISEFCRKARLTPRQQVELFHTVVLAIQHAHANGVIHRDIKPSNVLVDGIGRPKVIDFGIAHLTREGAFPDPDQSGAIIGTIPFMSPEQVRGERVEAPSDIYSLGVLLYSMLCGRLPYPRPEAHPREIAVQIVREDVVRPKRSDGVPRDLEYVLLRALRKVPGERYQSAAELAAELSRFLARERVHARRRNLFVDSWRLATKHPISAAIATSLCLALSIASGIAVAKSIRAVRAANRVSRVKVYLASTWLAPSASSSLEDLKSSSVHEPLQVRSMLDSAVSGLDDAFGDDPLGYAELAGLFGGAYRLNGELDLADGLLQRSLDIRRSELGADHPDTFAIQHELAVLRYSQGRLREAEDLLRPIAHPEVEIAPAEDPVRLYRLGWLGILLLEQGRMTDAEILLVSVYEARMRMLGPGHRETINSQCMLSRLRKAQGSQQEALALLESAVVAARENLTAPDLDLAAVLSSYGALLAELHRFEDAESHFREALEMESSISGENHPRTFTYKNNLATLLAYQKRPAEACELWESILGQQEQALGSRHPNVQGTRTNLGRALHMQGQDVRAEALISQAVAVMADEPESELATVARGYLGSVRADLGRASEAEPDLDYAFARLQGRLGALHPVLLELGAKRAECLRLLGRAEGSRALALEMLSRMEPASDKVLNLVLACRNTLALLREDSGDLDGAEELLVESLFRAQDTLGDSAPSTISCRVQLGSFLVRADKLDEAEEFLVPGLQDLERMLGPTDPRLGVPLEALATLHEHRGRIQEAADCRSRSIAARSSAKPLER